MSYSGSMALSSFYMPQSVSNQTISSGLFEGCLSKQNLFHNEFSMPSLGGNTALIFSVSLQSDGDASHPAASIQISNSDTITTRVGTQVASANASAQRAYNSTNPIITTRSNISLTTQIFDSGDLVVTDTFAMIVLPIKD